MVKKLFKIIFILVLGAIGGVLAQVFLLPYLAGQPLLASLQFVKQLREKEILVHKTEEIIIEENRALTEAVEKVKKVVVGVRSLTLAGQVLEGSGLIVTNDGLIVTLAELVPQGSDFAFWVEGKKVAYQILRRDPKENLALVKIEGDNLPTVGFGDFGQMRIGERVFLVGTIFIRDMSELLADANNSDLSLIVNEGIIKSFSQDFIETNIFEKDSVSGSPLFNIKGLVVGMNIVDDSGQVITIPVLKIRKFIGI